MKNTMNKYIKDIKFAIVIFGCLMASCSKMDDYRDDFVPQGEISYPGRIDSVTAFPGHNRLMLTGLLTSDPKITQVKVYWNSYKDSIVQNITRTSNVDTVRLLIDDIEENTWNFTLYTLDAQNNESVPVNVSGNVYGEKYMNSLNERLVESAELTESGAVIYWKEAGYLDGIISTEVKYTATDGSIKSVYVEPEEDLLVIPDYQLGNDFECRSLYMPTSLCIDTFYTAFTTQGLRQDISELYLKNTNSPIQYSVWDGWRWGVPADWTVNDAVKNANGYGGFEMRSGVGFISLEAGWGLPAVPNGKIYQSITLPAGKYSFEIDLGPNGSGGTKYIVAALGETMPDFDQVYNESLTYANVTDRSIQFELEEESVVSVGFVCNLPGNGEYCKIGSVKLMSLP